MQQLFDRKIWKKALATPEEIESAKKFGEPFRYTEKTMTIFGYRWRGCSYIIDIKTHDGSFTKSIIAEPT
jgi:hypothetical protein